MADPTPVAPTDDGGPPASSPSHQLALPSPTTTTSTTTSSSSTSKPAAGGWSFPKSFHSPSSSSSTPRSGSSPASGAGRLKAGLAKFDRYLEQALFEDTASPKRPSTSGIPTSSPMLAPPVVIRASNSNVGVAAAGVNTASPSGGSASGVWSSGLDRLKRFAQSGSGASGSGISDGRRASSEGEHEEEEDEEEDPRAVGGFGKRPPSFSRGSGGAAVEASEPPALAPALPVVSDKEREKAAVALVTQQLELAQGATLMLMHKGKGLPLVALPAEVQSLVKISWLRLHLHPSYWTEVHAAAAGSATIDPATVVARYIVREEPLPELDGQSLYRSSTHADAAAGSLLALQLASAPLGSVSRRLFSLPVEPAGEVKAAVEAFLQSGAWATAEARLRVHVASRPQQQEQQQHMSEGESDVAVHEVGLEVSSRAGQLKIEALNADTPRGYIVRLTRGIKARAPATRPTVLEIDVPIQSGGGQGAISYYGDRSGELANYLQQLVAPPTGAAADAFFGGELQSEPPEEGEEEGASRVATLSLQLPAMAARDALATVLSMRLANASKAPWDEIEALKAGAAARAAMEAEAARRRLEEERDRALRERDQTSQALQLERAGASTLKEQLAAATERCKQLEGELQTAHADAAAAAAALRAEAEAATARATALAAELAGTQEVGRKEREALETARVDGEQRLRQRAEEVARAMNDDLNRARLEAHQARKKAESLARELKLALGGGGDATGSVGGNGGGSGGGRAAVAVMSPRMGSGAVELAQLRIRVGDLEAKLEAAQQERAAYKQALVDALASLPEPPPKPSKATRPPASAFPVPPPQQAPTSPSAQSPSSGAGRR